MGSNCTFKVGDRVRCIYNDNGTSNYVGSLGYIVRIDDHVNYPYTVQFEGYIDTVDVGSHEIVHYIINNNETVSGSTRIGIDMGISYRTTIEQDLKRIKNNE